MRRVAITQRLDRFDKIGETREALDARLAGLIWQMGMVPIPVCSGVADHDTYFDALRPDCIVLSGGPDINAYPERDALEASFLARAARESVPVLGICRGLQMINHVQGGSLRPINDHVATRHMVRGPLFPNAVEVNSYHCNGITSETLGRDLVPCAFSDDGNVEAVRHTSLPWLGIMWHPEREAKVSEFDFNLMQRHLSE